MKKILFVLLFLVLLMPELYSQFSSSAAFFPLQVGNSWVYRRFQTPAAVETFLKISIAKDTLVNNKKYFFIHHSPAQPDYWLRFDTVAGILYHHIDTEIPYVKLSATTGDTTNFICSGVVDTVFFNAQTRLKKFYKDYSAPHNFSGTEMQLAKSFGQTYYYEYSVTTTSSNYLYAWLEGCIINGVLYGDTTLPLGLNQVSSQVPAGFSLHQNYPNPFNPATQISFDIPKSSLVRLVVYDALGKESAVLVNENLRSGLYKTNWNATDSPSGVYFYQLTAGEFTETRKMIFIK